MKLYTMKKLCHSPFYLRSYDFFIVFIERPQINTNICTRQKQCVQCNVFYCLFSIYSHVVHSFIPSLKMVLLL